MSLATKVLLGFLGLGGVGTTPLIWVSPAPPPPPYIPPEGYKLCHRLTTGIKNYKVALYICSRNDGTDKPSFFKKKESKETIEKTKNNKDQWNQVTNIARLSYTDWELSFKDGVKEKLKWPPYWTRISWDMKPEEHCLLKNKKSASGYDELTCRKDNKVVLTQSVYL
ncbi:hypothetical protein OVS_01355 [Mycoplasma ovis str. Michigan]|uniref:C-type lectin domain-containing protein n=1 Tax=Mycoplasma ovis str. Michigan TaxID=1415773 RepID=A0ABN4BLD6_9MOLU|nr:hypothetical protein [Mycoplasma ovis]AHC40196.1 hypothetical protein OVS_01355 [Mycoplasma ovis str. Michigan]